MLFISPKTIEEIRTKVKNENIGRKDPILAFILSIILPGAGQLYCGYIGLGILVFGLAIIGYIFLSPGIALAIGSAIHAKNLAKVISNINDEIDTQKKEDSDLIKENKIKSSNEKKYKKLNTINSIDFISDLENLYKLYKNEMITTQEFNERKKLLIDNIAGKMIDIDNIKFLTILIPLKEEGTLDKSNIDNIKKNLNLDSKNS